jgi:hypothetical protein
LYRFLRGNPFYWVDPAGTFTGTNPVTDNPPGTGIPIPPILPIDPIDLLPPVLIIVGTLIPYPISPGTLPVRPKPPWRCKPQNATCPQDTYDALYDAVQNTCPDKFLPKGTKIRCKSHMCCSTVNLFQRLWTDCAAAQRNLSKTCFANDNDPLEQGAQQDDTMAARCEELYRRQLCDKTC